MLPYVTQINTIAFIKFSDIGSNAVHTVMWELVLRGTVYDGMLEFEKDGTCQNHQQCKTAETVGVQHG
jgi:hypothetical protein